MTCAREPVAQRLGAFLKVLGQLIDHQYPHAGAPRIPERVVRGLGGVGAMLGALHP